MHPNAQDWPVRLHLRIDWSEMDVFGHVNNVMFMKYVQAARVHYWEVWGLAAYYEAHRIGPMLRATQCSFLRPLYYPGHIEVRSSLAYIRETSFSLKHVIHNAEGQTAAEAEDVMVLYDFAQGAKTPMPDALRRQAEALEGRAF